MTGNYDFTSLCEDVAQFLSRKFPEAEISVSVVTNPTVGGWRLKVYYTNTKGVRGVCYFSEADNIKDVVYKLEFFVNAEKHSQSA